MKTKLNPLNLDHVATCKLCPNLGAEHVPSDGSPYADLMIIGQSPGTQEVIERKPFVGPSGELVTYMLDEADLSREEVYVTNVLKCHPPNNRPALVGEKGNCWRKWLWPEIRAVKPKLILLLGRDAHSTLIPDRIKFGHLVETKSRSYTFLTSYHPSYFLRRNDMETFVKGVGKKVKDLLEVLEEEL